MAADDVAVSTPELNAVMGDLRLFPDQTRLAVVDAEAGLGWVPADLRALDGSAFVGCARTLLRGVAATAAAKGVEFSLGVELEFTLLGGEGRDRPAHTGPGYGVRPFLELEEFHLALLDALRRAGVAVAQLHPEYGLGQIELSLSPNDPLAAIDALQLARFVVARTARRHGFDASFAPVASVGVGNGLHLHFSARRDGRNLFADPDGPYGIAVDGGRMIAGVLDGLRRGIALVAGSSVSFQRLRPKNWAGGFLCWGDGNREAAVRLMRGYRGAEDREANVEVKCADGSSNPYLAAAWIFASAMRGLADDRTPPAPIDGDPSDLDATARAAAGIELFPGDLTAALDVLEADPVVEELLGTVLRDAYVAVRRRDAAVYGVLPLADAVAAARWRS